MCTASVPAMSLEAVLGRSIVSVEAVARRSCYLHVRFLVNGASSIMLHWSPDSLTTIFESTSCPRNDQQSRQGEPSCHDDALSLHLNTGPFDFGRYPFSFNVVKQFIFIRHGEKVRKGVL